MKIVADDKIPFLKGVLDNTVEMVYLPGGKITPSDVRDADALITRTRTRCDRRLLAGSRVKFIATATIGFDHIDTAAMAELGIEWTNAPGCNAASVAEYIAGALTDFRQPLAGRVLGVVGVGNVGRLVAEVGRAFGMTVLLNDPPRAEREGAAGFVSLSEIERQADFITFHVPLVRGGAHPTRSLADAGFFARLRPGAVVLNSSRGEVVAGEALKDALKSGRLAGAVLDVWEHEPEIDRELLQLVHRGTPHIAGYSTDGKANGTAMAVQAVARRFGLTGFETWRPARLPEPEHPVIRLDSSLPPEEQLRLACRHAYPIERDAAALLAAPGSFEQLRGDYWMRREPGAFRVRGGSEAVRSILEKLHFQLEG